MSCSTQAKAIMFLMRMPTRLRHDIYQATLTVNSLHFLEVKHIEFESRYK